jgi:ribosomal protein L12E/L44/L45/RPP1/RPP2
VTESHARLGRAGQEGIRLCRDGAGVELDDVRVNARLGEPESWDLEEPVSELDDAVTALAVSSAEGTEGVAAFRQKRPPTFAGAG